MLLIPAAVSLAACVWLLALHPTAAGRVYAACGGVYIYVALAWLWAVDGVRPQAADYVGVLLGLLGMGVIMFAPPPMKLSDVLQFVNFSARSARVGCC